jgi:hypothetical protein
MGSGNGILHFNLLLESCWSFSIVSYSKITQSFENWISFRHEVKCLGDNCSVMFVRKSWNKLMGCSSEIGHS